MIKLNRKKFDLCLRYTGLLAVLILCVISCDQYSDDVIARQGAEHLILIKLRKDTSEKIKQEIVNRFMALNRSLKNGKQYLKAEYGFQNSKEGLDAGFEIGFRIYFKSVEDGEYFEGKPRVTDTGDNGKFDHMYDDFKHFITPYLDTDNGLFTFDFTSNNKREDQDVPGKGYRLDHWVLFKFRSDITLPEKQMVIDRFLALKNSMKKETSYIPFIEYGYEDSKIKKDSGFEVAFRVGFSSLKNRDYYVGKPFQTDPGTFDPMHDDFKNFVGPYLDPTGGVLVFDYEVIRP
ncbi:Dabb family protein [Chryseobacterium sp. ISL-6]|uniref:Dabb family protein n=1 Tax=Chryseobacterium sp. ISL-6 TaxID=2819143 RepID=UPI001BE92541|nr:Dabb family protein [Chryseobacterium sp. ISL-6]MBT2623671.1 Dabb family protein [Chryseobacterium sp. ISL-6]